MKKKLVNPHDSLFRQVWSDPENAKGFLSAWLPEKTVAVMNMETLEICRDSYVSKSLKTYYSDILYKIRLAGSEGYIYLLFEHKSRPDAMTPFQLLKYMIRIWEQYQRETKRKGKLPVIIPVVLYQGREAWGIGDRFSSVIDAAETGSADVLAGYIPDFRYQLCDLSVYSDDEIKGNVISRVMLLAMKHIKDNDLDKRLPGILSLLHELIVGDPDGTGSALQYVETLLRYICAAAGHMTEDVFEQAVKKSFPENSEVWSMATLAEKWFNDGVEKGIERGIEQGIERGIVQGIEKGMEQGLRKGLVEGLELAVLFRFGESSETERIIELINKIEHIDRLKNVRKDIMGSATAMELIARLS